MRKDFLKNKDAIAYGLVIIFTSLVITALLWYVFQEPINLLVDIFNADVAEGIISTESTASASILLKVFEFGIPIFTAIALFEYAIVRAIESKYENP